MCQLFVWRRQTAGRGIASGQFLVILQYSRVRQEEKCQMGEVSQMRTHWSRQEDHRTEDHVSSLLHLIILGIHRERRQKLQGEHQKRLTTSFGRR